ncbi:nucleopolyhedrovirus P10 family protein [Streptomyces sp. NPDC006012]|uniref:nucleopolyhedrovirus P10 family protein n=1 Tax=Streptomyces sp. NPDC006012 TaxID=3364739 RepID=UPI0036A50FEF
MTADRWTRAVRQQVGLGRLLPLGGPRDAGWITEAAAEAVLRHAAAEVPGVLLGALRIARAEPDGVGEPAVPPPPSALPVGPLRVVADFAAVAAEPLPATADRLRQALASAADLRLGLAVAEVDLRVTALLDGPVDVPQVRPPQPGRARQSAEPDETRAATAALSVPGVARLTGSLGGLGRAVRIEHDDRPGALPHRHVRVELAVAGGHRPLDVARGVRTAVAAELAGRPTVAVVVTAVG